MKIQSQESLAPGPAPGDLIRAVRTRVGITLTELSERTGLAVSSLSKLEKGRISLSYDKIMLISRGLGVDMAELLDTSEQPGTHPGLGGRRVFQAAGDGQLVETKSYKQLYLATELLNKRFTPLVVELRARTMEEFRAEFGDFIRHPGDEFVYVVEGEVEFHTEAYAPMHLKTGDSVYFDSEMGHAYLKAADGPCRVLGICAPRGKEDHMKETFVSMSERLTKLPGKKSEAAARPAKNATKAARK